MYCNQSKLASVAPKTLNTAAAPMLSSPSPLPAASASLRDATKEVADTSASVPPAMLPRIAPPLEKSGVAALAGAADARAHLC